LARVLALEPRLVVADEPTSGLDPKRRDQVLEALIGNLPEGAGCILVTHDMTEARQWCDRVFAMLAGRVIEEVAIRVDDPVHPYASILFDPWSGALPSGRLAETGCSYSLDCPLKDAEIEAQCSSVVPELANVCDDADQRIHKVACHALGEGTHEL
jgi:ABC-type dipeptide/oligopeptide/nickel transport system ATPase component